MNKINGDIGEEKLPRKIQHFFSAYFMYVARKEGHLKIFDLFLQLKCIL